jgi:hypothetical protein
MGLRRWLTDRIAHFLTQPLRHFEHRTRHDLGSLQRHVRPGDVLLVEGDERVSAVIKALTQSCWSHAALYIGDALLRRGGREREQALERFGPERSRHLLVEALFEGVVVSPLDKYRSFHLRLCRPHRLRSDDLQRVVDQALAAVGWPYDVRNILDLARHLLLLALMPTRYRRAVGSLGSSRATEVICSSLVGQLFHTVGFPVLPMGQEVPQLPPPRRGLARLLRRERSPYPGIFLPRHPTLLAPRDFDLSPYFEIVKFDAIAGGDFDYQRIAWASGSELQIRGAGRRRAGAGGP